MYKSKVAQKAPLVEKLLIIEGITRSGKFLLANILNGLENIEPAQYSVLLEEIPLLTSLGKIEPDTAKEMLRCEIDSRSYELLIGRNLNIRKSDKSSIYNNPNYRQLLARSNQSDPIFLLNNFFKKKPYSPFILHESMANLNIYFETFPKMKCISIFRNPVDLAYSWYKRGLGKRWGTDPLLFQIPFSAKLNSNKLPRTKSPRYCLSSLQERRKHHNSLPSNNSEVCNRFFCIHPHFKKAGFSASDYKIPWFAIGWENTYLKSNEMTRCILSIKSLIQKAKEGYNNLPSTSRNRILMVNYDDLLLNPDPEIKKMSKFLDVEILAQMKAILRREKLPVKRQKTKLEGKLKEITALTDKKYLEELLNLPAEFVS